MPVVGSNLIFQEVDYFENFTIYSPCAVRKVYRFQTRKMMIVTFLTVTLCVMLDTILFMQLTGDWKRDIMATVNKRKVLSVEGKVSVATNGKWKKEKRTYVGNSVS